MSQAFEWYDHYQDTRERKIWTEKEHQIPGLRMIGFHNASHALSPLAEHFHPGCFEFTYVLQGNLHFSADNRDFDLSGGDVFFTKPSEVHSTGCFPMSVHRICWFQLEVEDPDRFLFLAPETAGWIIRQLNQLESRVSRANSAAEEMLKQVLSGITSGTPAGRIQAAAQLTTLLCQILTASSQDHIPASPDIARAAAYIQQHIREKITMEQLADTAILSISQFKQKFKAQLGISPRNYINYRKIELARQALEQGEHVTSIAMSLGFSSSDYFAVVFKRYTTLSPTEYARRHAGSGPEASPSNLSAH